MRKVFQAFLLLILSIGLFSCAGKQINQNKYVLKEITKQRKEKSPILANFPYDKKVNQSELDVLYEKKLNYKPFQPESKHSGELLGFHFENISLEELLKILTNQEFGFSYVSTVPLTQKVTVHMENISQRELLSLIKEILSSLGYMVIIDSKKKLIKIYQPKAVSSLYSSDIFIYTPNYISAKDLYNLILNIVDKNTTKVFFKGQALVVVAPTYEIELIRRLVKSTDAPIYSGKYISFIKTKTPAKILRKNLKKIFSLLGITNKGIVEDLSENLIVVVTSDKQFLNDIKEWINILENSSQNVSTNLYIIKLNYLKAEEVAQLLNELDIWNVGSFEQIAKQAPSKENSLPSNSQINLSLGKQKPANNSKEESINVASQASVQKRESIVSQSRHRIAKVNIVANDKTNSLIIKATPLQYKLIESLVKRLDNVPEQVFIEMVVAEVSIGDSLNFGLEGLFKGFIDSYSFNVETSLGLRGNPGSLLGFKAIIFGKNNDIRGILNFLASKTKLNVLSAPYILVKNNEEAQIEIGAEVPIITEQMTSTSGGVPVITTAIQYRSTGIILKVKPTISSDGSVTLHIKEEVSDALPNTISPEVQSPIITKRATQTVLILKDGQIALIGGILQQRMEKNERGVPFLSNIPGIGYAFKREDKAQSKTELIVLLRTHIIGNPSEIPEVREETLNRLHEIKRLIKLIHSTENES